MSGVTGLAHITINCGDHERSIAFYRLLGFEIVQDFPEGFYSRVAKGLNVGAHRLKGVLMAVPGSAPGTMLDLVHWSEPRLDPMKDVPLNTPRLIRFGVYTRDFFGDVARLKAAGVSFLSEPMMRDGPDGQQPVFVCCRDPDDNVVELTPLSSGAET